MRRLVLVWMWLLCGMAGPCKLPEPYYDDNTGLTGVRTEEGSLAGKWGAVLEWATIVRLPVVGDRNAGSRGFRLFTRTWDDGAKVYHDSFTWCANEVFEVEGTASSFTREQMERLRPTPFDLNVDHDTGHAVSTLIVNNWGVALPDPVNTPLPTKDNYQQSPESTFILDEDGDGNPGVTAHMCCSITADAFVLSRAVFTLDGTVVAQDRIRGLGRGQKSEQHTVDGTNRLVVGESNTRYDPDPKASWFDMVKLGDNATCDDVLAARDSGQLAARRPF